MGFVIDWSSKNIFPQVMELMEKYTHYKIFSYSLWACVTFLFIVLCVFGIAYPITQYYKYKNKTEESNVWCDHYDYISDSMSLTAMLTIMGSCLVLMLVTTGFVISVVGLIQWSFIPEIKLIQMVNVMLK